MKKLITIVIALMALPALAGSWEYKVNEDPFATKPDVMAVQTSEDGQHQIVFVCQENGTALKFRMFSPNNYYVSLMDHHSGSSRLGFQDVKLKVDDGEIREMSVMYILPFLNVLMVEEIPVWFVQELQSGNEAVFRVASSAGVYTPTFSLAGSEEAISKVLSACGVELPVAAIREKQVTTGTYGLFGGEKAPATYTLPGKIPTHGVAG